MVLLSPLGCDQQKLVALHQAAPDRPVIPFGN
jgi:hypothetical protein